MKNTQQPEHTQDGPLSAPQRARRLKQVSDNHPSRLGLFKRVLSGRNGYAQCIKAFCLECNGFETAAIRDCTALGCPLWHRRPYQVKKAKGGV